MLVMLPERHSNIADDVVCQGLTHTVSLVGEVI